ncbi:MAG TPA: hypothetical protein VF194_06000 [Ferrovibrio sp.]|uniref:hypothetical protein n=1 Tax=Ferrovibrio sp. TaxID=1917215 RepID=UPI002ED3E8AD
MADNKQGNPVPLRPPRQQTDLPGAHGGPTGPAHHTPLSRGAPRRMPYGPGTYGNDQFAAEHHDDFHDPSLGCDTDRHDVPPAQAAAEKRRSPDDWKP